MSVTALRSPRQPSHRPTQLRIICGPVRPRVAFRVSTYSLLSLTSRSKITSAGDSRRSSTSRLYAMPSSESIASLGKRWALDRSLVRPHREVDDLVHMAIEHTDIARHRAPPTKQHPDLKVRMAIQALEAVLPTRIRDVGNDLIGVAVAQFHHSVADRFVA